jgi:hypothetical protein
MLIAGQERHQIARRSSASKTRETVRVFGMERIDVRAVAGPRDGLL